jgi:serine/threonine protein kinase
MTISCPTCFTDNPDNAITCQSCGEILNASVASADDLMDLPPGTILKQQYKVEKKLGSGGFGITYKVIDLTKSTTLALKELIPEKAVRIGNSIAWPSIITPQKRQQQIQEVKREAEYLSKCIHTGIVRVHDWFEENSTAYIVMDLAEGKSLSKILLEQKRLPESFVKKYFIQIGEALKIVHSQNLLHRDINPNNIIINEQKGLALLIDFGNAREFIAGQSIDHTRNLTPGYAPLEQYSLRARRGPATDFYSVCATMYALLTGVEPPEPTERMVKDELIPPRQLVPSISSLTEQIILSGLKVQVADRFQTADELIDALQGRFVPPNLRNARQLVNQDKLSEAVQAYQRIDAQDAAKPAAMVELAMVLAHIDEQQAEVVAHQAIQLNSQDGRGYGVLGLLRCRQKSWAEAVKNLEKAAQLHPDEAWIQANFAWALGKTNQWPRAISAVDKALQIDSNLPFVLGLKAWILTSQNQWKLAIPPARQALFKTRQLSNAIQKQTLQTWVYPCLVTALDKALAGRNSLDVERCLQEASAHIPDSSFMLIFKGYQESLRNDWSNAIANFQRANQASKGDSLAYQNLGISYEHLNDVPKAIQAYESGRQIEPENLMILFRLGTLRAKQGDLAQAKELMEKLVKLAPDLAEAHHNLGWIMLCQRKQNPNLRIYRDIRFAYRRAFELYNQQQKSNLADAIRQAFEAIGGTI